MNSSKVLTFFKKYNSVDLLAKLSALNLVFENQNKNALLTDAIVLGLHYINNNQSINFEEFVKFIGLLDSNQMLDSSVSSFAEKLFWDSDYHMFNGINQASTFVLNNISDLLLYVDSKLPIEYINKLSRFIRCLTSISEKIWKGLDLSWDEIKDHQYIENIIVPSNINQLASMVIIPKEEIFSYVSQEEVDKYLICNKKIPAISKSINKQLEPFYYYCPFYQINDDSYLLLDPTSLAMFLNNLSLILANEFNCFDLFLDEYHRYVFDHAIQKCKILSGVSPFQKEEKISFLNKDSAKQIAFKISHSKILYFYCLKVDDFDSKYVRNNTREELSFALTQLKELGFEESEIYPIFLFSSFSGTFVFQYDFTFANKPIMLSCYDVYSIYENEKNETHLFEEYFCFKNYYFKNGQPVTNRDVDVLAFLNENRYDFYFNDELKTRDIIVSLADDFLYPYITKALSEDNILSFAPSLHHPIKLRKQEDGLYSIDPLMPIPLNVLPVAIKLDNGGFWIYCKNRQQEDQLVCRVIGYWINQIRDSLNNKVDEVYFIQVEQDNESFMRCVSRSNSICLLFYSKRFLSEYKNNDNTNEIKMVDSVLHALNLLTIDVVSALNKSSINREKKILYSIDTDKNPFLLPLVEPLIPITGGKILETMWDDYIGDYLSSTLKIPYGPISDSNSIMKSIVGHLFNELEVFLRQFNWLESIKMVYLYCESKTQEISLFQDNMKHQVALYPDKQKQIEENYNILNSLSVSFRFVAEYLAAVRPNGLKTMDEFDLKYASCLVRCIVKYARISDAMFFGIANDKIEFLKSGRIAYDEASMNKFYSIVGNTVIDDLLKKMNIDIKTKGENKPQEEIDKAYLMEYGFTTNDLKETALVLCAIGSKQEGDLKHSTKSDIEIFIDSHPELSISKNTFWDVVDFLSIKQRSAFFDGTIEKRELYPWKYNRTESLVYKPIIQNGINYYWGNRILVNSYLFIMNSIDIGKAKGKKNGSGPIAELNGKMLERRGALFNDYCFEVLQTTMQEIYFEKNVKAINSKKLEDEEGKELGDIDILGIDSRARKIYLIEVKDFFYSRDPHELADEYKDLFGTNNKKRSLLEKELRRVKWAENHVNDIKNAYCLEGNDWKIKYCFLSDKPMLSCEFTSKKINSISIKHISLNYLRKL